MSIILTLSVLVSNSQTFGIRSITNQKFGMRLDQSFKPINLRLSTTSYKPEGDYRTEFVVMLIAGVAMTTASILEGGYQYGTYSGPSNSGTYTIPPFWNQTPRQILFCTGISFTITGTIGTIRN